MITLGVLALAAIALGRHVGDAAERLPRVDPVPRPKPKRQVCSAMFDAPCSVSWNTGACIFCGRPPADVDARARRTVPALAPRATPVAPALDVPAPTAPRLGRYRGLLLL